MSLGIDYQDSAYRYSTQATSRYQNYGNYSSSPYYANEEEALLQMRTNETDIFSLSHTSGCTDGKDDGKIGFFSALGNAVKGIGKSIVNGVKGCFTDSEGKFSLGKTLLTIGVGALCVAFPAVGLVACGIGAVAGTVQVAKGIGKAATAKTDAEAKEAWQNIGAGTFTVVTSALGAKASYAAVKGTSTAGLDNIAKAVDKADDVSAVLKNLDNADDVANILKALDNTDDVAAALQNIEGLDPSKVETLLKAVDNGDDAAALAVRLFGKMDDASALGQVSEGLTGVDKLKAQGLALGQDMLSSTKNRAVSLAETASTLNATRKANAESLKDAQTALKEATSDLTKEQKTALRKFNQAQAKGDTEATENALQEALKVFDDDTFNGILEAQEQVAQCKSQTLTAQARQMVDDKISDFKEGRAETAAEKKQARNDYHAAKKDYNAGKKAGDDIIMQDAMSRMETAQATLRENSAITHAVDTLRNTKELPATLTKQAKAVLEFLQDGNNSYAQAVQEFGYSNVLEALEVFSGYRLADGVV